MKLYIAPPADVIAEMDWDETLQDVADLVRADVILTDGPLDPVAAILADVLEIDVQPLSHLVGR